MCAEQSRSPWKPWLPGPNGFVQVQGFLAKLLKNLALDKIILPRQNYFIRTLFTGCSSKCWILSILTLNMKLLLFHIQRTIRQANCSADIKIRIKNCPAFRTNRPKGGVSNEMIAWLAASNKLQAISSGWKTASNSSGLR